MPSDVDLTVRPATPDDADPLATLYLEARDAAYPAIPRGVHPPDDVRRWMRSRLDAPGVELWLAERTGAQARDLRPVGLLLLEDDWLHSLYVAPGLTGRGIGTVLLDLAKSLRPGGLGLWVFESNSGARRFYERHGFVVLRRTDGADNEERAPDVEMAWPGRSDGPLELLRARVDELDDRLAAVLAERAGITAAIQQVKPVAGHAGRDPAREAAIVSRMARLAPALGAQRLARIMDVVITESLDAALDRPDGSSTDPGGHP